MNRLMICCVRFPDGESIVLTCSMHWQADEAFSQGRFRVAVDAYTEALAVAPDHSVHNEKLFLGLCKACVKLGRGRDAIRHCSSVLLLNEESLEALVQV